MFMLEMLYRRRSIRKYKDIEIPQKDVDKLIRAALLAPSSRSRLPWEFILVSDKEILESLAKSKEHGSSFLKDAALGIVVLADENVTDVWIEDTSIASLLIQLQAETMGLGSCWIQIRNRMHDEKITSENYIAKILDVPNNYRIESIVALGFPNETKSPHSEEDLKFNKIHTNKFGNN